ncbi:uncharacterized protein TrAtP1_006238 [Trichoderma atroviride]|uniref:uncharacterized protein n=1 Tax=Hypocrea atroviridis TaxID=63577 RepID=UPI003327B288|nr:hypothetical protein TrAtP1_006238 [Trichoderma atroviride]
MARDSSSKSHRLPAYIVNPLRRLSAQQLSASLLLTGCSMLALVAIGIGHRHEPRYLHTSTDHQRFDRLQCVTERWMLLQVAARPGSMQIGHPPYTQLQGPKSSHLLYLYRTTTLSAAHAPGAAKVALDP